jgi:hypothetical protein
LKCKDQDLQSLETIILVRFDFSIEIPYFDSNKKLNKFNQSVLLKHQKTFLVEVDGARYHEQLIDNLKDFEISNFSNTVSHITEANVYIDKNDFINTGHANLAITLS